MKTFGVNQYGTIDQLAELELPTPELKAKQVLLKVQAVGINPYDIKVRNGEAAKTRPLSLPVVPGSDVVGEVVQTGSQETLWQVGDTLIGRAAIGAYGELVAVGEKMAVKLPTTMTPAQGAALPTTGVTAYDLVETELAVQAGQTVVVIGAAGNVGSLVVQLAIQNGAQVISIASTKNKQFLKELGVTLNLDYHDPLPDNLLASADFVVNTVNGGGHLRRAVQLVKPTGRIITLNDVPAKPFTSAVKIEAFNDASFHQNQRALTFLTKSFTEQRLKIRIGKILPFTLAGVKKSHQLIADHQVAGKVVLSKEQAPD